MGGKKYTKDGKKIPPKEAKASNQPPVDDQKTPSGSQQRLPPEASLSKPLQQMTVSEPKPSTSPLGTQPKQIQPIKQQQVPVVVDKRNQPTQPQAWGVKQQQQQQKPGQKQQGPSKPSAQGTSQQKYGIQDRGQSSSKGEVKSFKFDPKAGSNKSKEEEVKYPSVVVPFLGKGTRGTDLGPIATNYMKLDVKKTMPEFAFMYDVEITSKGPKKLYTRAFKLFVQKYLKMQNLPFDGKKIAYSPRELNIGGELVGEVSVMNPETRVNWDYVVVIKPADNEPIPIRAVLMNKNINPIRVQDAMQALDIILKSAFHEHLDEGIQGGRRFFFRPNNRAEEQRLYLKDFCYLRLGLFQSMHLGEIPLLNVDVCHKAFPKRYNSLIELLADMGRELSTRNRQVQIDLDRPLPQNAEEKLVAHLKGLEICYNRDANDKKIYKFYELGNIPAQEMFTLRRDGLEERKSVSDYFREINRSIRYPGLPTIRLGRRDNFISVPMEFCSISDDQVINKKCTDNQTREMIRHAAGTTNDRERKIRELTGRVNHNETPAIIGFGMRIDTKFIKVSARLLPPPKIEYRGAQCIDVRNGSWMMKPDTQFLVSPDSAKFAIINGNKYTNENLLRDFMRQLIEKSSQIGLRMEPIPNNIRTVISERDLRRQFDELGKQADIVFCVVPYGGAITYAKIKQIAELECGVLTQCIKAKTMEGRDGRGMDRSTIENILKKVNAKLNGTNHKLHNAAILKDYDKGKVMFIGADVTHPPPGLNEAQRFSVVGVSASYDRNGFHYNTAWHLQHGEIISDFRRIVREHLEVFRKENRGTLPQKIIYYRDGVSDSQFDEVMAREKVAITEACTDVRQGNEKIDIKLTVIIVQKRHHTRFFPQDNKIIPRDKFNNVPPGTVVDTTIIRPDESHFFLCSHQSIQGVARPTKYCVLFDENNLTADDLQDLTYNLCHLYSRCNRAVSYPAPTYYAHLLAARCKVYTENKAINVDDLDNEFRKLVVLPKIRRHTMFFV